MRKPKNILTTFLKMFLPSVKTRLAFFFTSIAFYTFIFIIIYIQYGEIEEMNVCDNLGDHLVGNVYIKVTTSSQ